jgi:hypothetical protein
MHTGEIELFLARHLGPRINLIVPNISYGLGTHEIDLLVVTPAHYAYEIEIKTSVSDLKADLKKSHGHRSNKIKLLYFAVPTEIKDKALELIPERAGLYVLTYDEKRTHTFIQIVKAPQVNKLARKLTDKELIKIGSLACMRIWNLKEIIYRLQKDTHGRINNR